MADEHLGASKEPLHALRTIWRQSPRSACPQSPFATGAHVPIIIFPIVLVALKHAAGS